MTSKALDSFLNDNIADLKERGLYNEIDPVQGPNGPEIKIGERTLINLLRIITLG